MEPESVTNHTAIPVRSSERYVILDVLRGLALLGIALANFPEFSLYSFLPVEAADVMAYGRNRPYRALSAIHLYRREPLLQSDGTVPVGLLYWA